MGSVTAGSWKLKLNYFGFFFSSMKINIKILCLASQTHGYIYFLL